MMLWPFIAQTCNGSVRDLQGAINGLLAYSIVYNSHIDIRLAERVIKRAVKVDDKPLTIDDIVETVCNHYNVTVTAVNSKSRKRDYVVAQTGNDVFGAEVHQDACFTYRQTRW